MHRSRARDLQLIQDLATAGRYEDAYRRCVLWDYANEARMGFQLAFLRPFAVPRMAEVLVGTGKITAAPERRSYNTGIMIHELISEGLESARGRQVVRHMNNAHRAPGVCQEDLTYVLAAFMVVPTRYIQRTGWRPMTTAERGATMHFYTRLGELMGIHEIPSSYQAAAELLDAYEAAQVGPSPAGQTLGEGVMTVLRARLPRPLRMLSGPLFASQLDDDRILAALGIDAGPSGVRTAIQRSVRLAATVRAQRPAPSSPSFYPGQPAGRAYPHGYDLDELTAHRS